jgi:pyrroline-5-carboxylate reductase
METLGIVGFGNMGEALAAGFRTEHPSTRILIADKRGDRTALGAERYGCIVADGWAELFSADAVVLAVKPQDLTALASQVGDAGRNAGIISIAAGTPIRFFEKHFASHRVVRFMPNLAAQEGRALVAVSIGEGADDELRERALAVARALGTPMELPEKLMPAMTGLSGSGIAYVFAFLHALALGGTKAGVPYDTALEAALTTLEGAVAAVRNRREHPVALLSKVASPAGTTIEGIRVLEERGFTAGVMEAVVAAARRAEEMET